MGREVTAVATLLMMAWAPKRRPLLPRGAGPRDLKAAYPDWTLVGEEPFDVSEAPFYRRVKSAQPRFYRLRLGEAQAAS